MYNKKTLALRKMQKSRIKGFEKKKSLIQLHFGSFGLKALESGRITAKQLETLRRGLSRFIKKNTAQLWFRQLPQYTVTKKPTEIRMGKGKGSIYAQIVRLRAGVVFCELEGLSFDFSLKLLDLIRRKVAVRARIVQRRRYF